MSETTKALIPSAGESKRAVPPHRVDKTPITMHLDTEMVEELRLISKILIKEYGRDGHTIEALVTAALQGTLPALRARVDEMDEAGMLNSSTLHPWQVWKMRRSAPR